MFFIGMIAVFVFLTGSYSFLFNTGNRVVNRLVEATKKGSEEKQIASCLEGCFYIFLHLVTSFLTFCLIVWAIVYQKGDQTIAFGVLAIFALSWFYGLVVSRRREAEKNLLKEAGKEYNYPPTPFFARLFGYLPELYCGYLLLVIAKVL